MNFGGNNTKLLKELPLGNAEFGQAICDALCEMVDIDGVTNPNGQNIEFTPSTWRKLADKENKTPEDNKKLEDIFYSSIKEVAQSYLLFMCRETGNQTGFINFDEYENFMLKYRFKSKKMSFDPKFITEAKAKIKNAFNLICACSDSSKNLITKELMYAFFYALTVITGTDEHGQFNGFRINGILKPCDYAVMEYFLFNRDAKNNMFLIKLKIGNRIMNGEG